MSMLFSAILGASFVLTATQGPEWAVLVIVSGGAAIATKIVEEKNG